MEEVSAEVLTLVIPAVVGVGVVAATVVLVFWLGVGKQRSFEEAKRLAVKHADEVLKEQFSPKPKKKPFSRRPKKSHGRGLDEDQGEDARSSDHPLKPILKPAVGKATTPERLPHKVEFQLETPQKEPEKTPRTNPPTPHPSAFKQFTVQASDKEPTSPASEVKAKPSTSQKAAPKTASEGGKSSGGAPKKTKQKAKQPSESVGELCFLINVQRVSVL